MNEDKLLRRVVVASLIGATVEWYDFFLYGVVAGIVFNQLYFPAGDPVVATLLAYTTFAVGFVTRPLGGIIFGHFGDRLGRKSMLVLTLMIMGIATFLIGLVPTYAQIGIWAPITLLLLRVLQGIGLGGDERRAPRRRRRQRGPRERLERSCWIPTACRSPNRTIRLTARHRSSRSIRSASPL